MGKLKLGVVTYMDKTKDVYVQFEKIAKAGFETCQLHCWDESLLYNQYAELIKEGARRAGVEITAFWCGWQGPAIWNFTEGPITLGLVPEAYRLYRLQTLMKGSDFAKAVGVSKLATHVGFIPENPNDPNYPGLISALKHIAQYCKNNGQYFLFETGQETPITLKRAIQDVGCDNLGINLDPANLIMYGKANPVDALDIIGMHVMEVHAKDGNYPTEGRLLGEEKPLGQGRVNFPAFIAKLKEIGYEGSLTIEREIFGEQQEKDIMAAKELLEKLI